MTAHCPLVNSFFLGGVNLPLWVDGGTVFGASSYSITPEGDNMDIPSRSHPEQEQATPERPFSSDLDDIDDTDRTDSYQHDGDEDHWITLGSIRLCADGIEQHPKWTMQGADSEQPWPHPHLDLAERRGWVRSQFLRHARYRDQFHHRAVLRIQVFPEDVNRSSRGSLKDFRKVIKWLIPFVDTAASTWNADFEDSVPIQNYGAPRADREESLFYIFNTLESPPVPDINTFKGSAHARRAMEDVLSDNILGMKSTLYPYQKRSVAAMLRREEKPAFSQDPRKPLLHDLRKKPFYLDIFEGAVAESPELYEEVRGGILAETMGYGKTLTCLALILATRGHYPGVSERSEQEPRELNSKTPSLLTLAARKIRQSGLPWKAEFYALTLQGEFYDTCVEELQKYHCEFRELRFNQSPPYRLVSDRVLRLCSATLVIVPPNLLMQWQNEIAKHIEPGALDLLVLDSTNKVIPDWQQLMNYDIILITKARFEQEHRAYASPFLELRWLRVICDEGHVFARSTPRTNSLMMLNSMSIERLWSISGTPSHSLHGVEVSLPSIDEAGSQSQSQSRSSAVSSALEQRRIPKAAKQEIEEIERLRLIVTHFFKIPPWGTMHGQAGLNWRKYLSPFDAAGNRRCAPGLRTLLQSLMVRHRLSDIDIDLQLPPLYNRTVYIKPSYYDKLTLNLFIMFLTSNAVTSERSDEDYMHHPRNREQLDRLFLNLRQATFHWVGVSPDDVVATVRNNNTYFDENLDRISDSDCVLLTESIQAGQRALDDAGWRAISTLFEIGVYVEKFPPQAAAAWSLTGESTEPLLMGTSQARGAREYLAKNRDSEYVVDGMVGAGLRALAEARQQACSDMGSKSGRSSNRSSSDASGIVSEEPVLKGHASRSLDANKTSSSHNNYSNNSNKRPVHADAQPASNTDMNTASPATAVTAAANHQLSQARIVGFTSAKLTYLCSQILSHPADVKSIIFYSHNNTAYFIAEGLELLGIELRIYAHTLPPPTRSQYLQLFNTDPTIKVLLMDLRQASHGLHVAAASRVYFVGPVWDVSVEAQAIKRAHRIGQTKPVYVETLVLEDTIEERMWRRRNHRRDLGTTTNTDTTNAAAAVKKGWLDDEGVVGILKNESFLAIAEGEKTNVPRLEYLDSDSDSDSDKRQWLFGDVREAAPAPAPTSEANAAEGHGNTTNTRNTTSSNEVDEIRPRKKRVMFTQE